MQDGHYSSLFNIMTEIDNLNLQKLPPPKCHANITFVPESLREWLLTLVHAIPSSGHPRITATAHLLRKTVLLAHLFLDTTKFVQNCTTYRTSKSPRHSQLGCYNHCPRHNAHNPTSLLTLSLTCLSHTVTPLYLPIIDRFSKACHLIPLPKLPTSPDYFAIMYFISTVYPRISS